MHLSTPFLDSMSFPTYFFILSLNACICLLWLKQRNRTYHLPHNEIFSLSLIIFIFGFIGSRLFHVFYEELPYYAENPWRVLEVWRGGFVFYGGAMCAGAACWGYILKKDPRRLELYLDLFAPVLCLGYSLGRIACFLAGCCFGRYCELPWSIAGRHPTQLYAFGAEMISLLILLRLERAKNNPSPKSPFKKNGSLFYLWIILHGSGRLIMEYFRDDFRGPQLAHLSISSWISLGLIFWGLYLWILD